MKILFFIMATAVFSLACSRSHIDINGEFTCLDDDQMILLEHISASKNKIVDTAYIKNSKFKFKINPAPATPEIYNIKHKQAIIPLLVAKGEKIKIKSIGDLSANYKVDGSIGSSLIKEISSTMNSGANDLDSLYRKYLSTTSENDKKAVAKHYRELYFKIKRDQLAFIVKNKGSIAAVYALFQRLPDDNVLFNGHNDVVYYNMVADSIAVASPNSPYIPILKGEIQKLEKNQQIAINSKAEYTATIANFPEIALEDMYGKEQSLSALSGKIILLSFWSSASQSSRLDNAELKEIYSKFAHRGFEIYQVSLDEVKYNWVTTIQQQKLPWISVYDPDNVGSKAAANYNIKAIPATFLIDANGNIVEKNIALDKLEDKLKSLL